MLRITRMTERPGLVTLKLEGKIVSDWVSLLQEEVLGCLRAGRAVKLDCSGVIFADEEALALLKRLRGKNLEIVKCPALIQSLLQETL